jgi:hypothetical protein
LTTFTEHLLTFDFLIGVIFFFVGTVAIVFVIFIAVAGPGVRLWLGLRSRGRRVVLVSLSYH